MIISRKLFLLSKPENLRVLSFLREFLQNSSWSHHLLWPALPSGTVNIMPVAQAAFVDLGRAGGERCTLFILFMEKTSKLGVGKEGTRRAPFPRANFTRCLLKS